MGLQNLLIWLGGTVALGWGWSKNFFDKFWLFAWTILWFIYEGWKLVGDLTIRAFNIYLSQLQAHTGGPPGHPGGQIGVWLAMANTFFPLDEAVHMLAAYVSLWVGIGLYKFICNWIPIIGPKDGA